MLGTRKTGEEIIKSFLAALGLYGLEKCVMTLTLYAGSYESKRSGCYDSTS